jgi:isoamylase
VRDVTHEEQRVSLTEMIAKANKAWHGVKLNQPDWSENSHAVAFSAELRQEKLAFHLIMNAYWEQLDFELPPPAAGGGSWRRWIDTFLPSPNDIVEWQSAPPVAGTTYRAGPRSVVMLWAGVG